MSMELKSQIFDVDASNFEALVIKGSQDRAVVVDFWAPWCGPCKTLGPMLEEVVRSLGPGVALAKVNVDENQELAMAFRVQGIPAVKVVRDGRLVDEFTGALPRDQVEALLRQHVPDAPPSKEELQEDQVAAARERLEGGDLRGAAAAFERLLAADAGADAARVGLARVRLLQGDFDAVRELVGKIEEATPEHDQGQALLTHLTFHQVCEETGGSQACAARRLATPDDLEVRYAFGCCAAVQGDYETALKEWFAIVEANRDFRQGAARDAMVSVFHLLGRQHPVVADYPQRLYRALY
ncbi:MAG: thioredoxin [Gemmatimonadota bacterium]